MTGSSSNVKQDLSLESFITMVRQDPTLKAEIKAALNQDDADGDGALQPAEVASLLVCLRARATGTHEEGGRVRIARD